MTHDCSVTPSSTPTALYTWVATRTIGEVMSRLSLCSGRPEEAKALVSRPALEVADVFRGHGPARHYDDLAAYGRM